MNLNPLKKDDNNQALAQALADANGLGAPAGNPADATPTAQPAASAADAAAPAVNDSPATEVIADPGSANPTDTTGDTTATASSASPSAGDETPPVPAADAAVTDDAVTSLSFDGNDLPAGLSSDADAHLPTDGVGDTGELDGVKKSALEQLRPLIEKLDLEPADKFDKYLMMLRASDDPALIKPAFEAAQLITGEKEKAQALLDIINEINYINSKQEA